jgi:hypothetical protein
MIALEITPTMLNLDTSWAHMSGRRNSELLRVKPLLLYSKCGGWNPQ